MLPNGRLLGERQNKKYLLNLRRYPIHEHTCPHVSHCPHLGGAALGTLVLMANEQELSWRALHARIDAEQARGDRLFEENQRLQKELDQVKLELKLERQNKFATNEQKRESSDTACHWHQLPKNPAGDRRTVRHHVHTGGADWIRDDAG